MIDSTKRQLVSQRPIKLTGIGETGPEYANFSKYYISHVSQLAVFVSYATFIKVSFHADVRCLFSASKSNDV